MLNLKTGWARRQPQAGLVASGGQGLQGNWCGRKGLEGGAAGLHPDTKAARTEAARARKSPAGKEKPVRKVNQIRKNKFL